MPRAIIIGATGATGRELLAQLLCKPEEWSRVTTIGRRAAESLPAGYPVSIEEAVARGQLIQKSVDMAKIAEAVDDFKQHDVVFCVVGTTRGQAGSAAAFREVDFGIVADSAKAAKAAGVPHYSLMTAQGAKANVWASELGCFHALYYMKTKGEAENAVIAQGFPRVSIFRPGMLDRGVGDRTGENIILSIFGGLKVADMARAMIGDALKAPERPSPTFFEDSEIRRMAKAFLGT